MLGAVNLDKHPDQTFIGRIERGFRRSQCFSLGSMTNKKTTKPEKATSASVIKNVSMTYTPSDWSTSSTSQETQHASMTRLVKLSLMDVGSL
jgi:hypothetical protein